MLAALLDTWYFYWSLILKYYTNHKTQAWSNALNNSTECYSTVTIFPPDVIVKMDQNFEFHDRNQ